MKKKPFWQQPRSIYKKESPTKAVLFLSEKLKNHQLWLSTSIAFVSTNAIGQ